MTYIVRCLAAAVVLPLVTLGAQAPVVRLGARVRVSNDETAYDYSVTGTLESLDSSMIILRRDNGGTVKLTRRPLTRLDVSTGPGSCSPGHRGKCVAIGLGIGAVVGVVAGVIIGEKEGCANGTEPACAPFLALAVPGALVRGIIGGLVGGEHWKTVPLPASVSLAPDGSGGFALGLSLPF